MGTAVKTSPIAAAPPFTVAPNNEREGQTVLPISYSGRNRARTDRFRLRVRKGGASSTVQTTPVMALR